MLCYAPVYKRMGEDTKVVRIYRASHSDIFSQGVGAEGPRESLRPVGTDDDGVVVYLVEEVAPLVVGVLDKRAHDVRRRVLQPKGGENKRGYFSRARGNKRTEEKRGEGGGWGGRVCLDRSCDWSFFGL